MDRKRHPMAQDGTSIVAFSIRVRAYEDVRYSVGSGSFCSTGVVSTLLA